MQSNIQPTWLFDLDNTLCDAREGILDQIQVKINKYLAQRFSIAETEATKIRHTLFLKYGTTLGGLIQEHGEMDVPEYFNYTYNVNLNHIQPASALNNLLGEIPGQKFVFTNAEATYAKRVLTQMEIEHHFEDIFDIVAADCISKPQQHPYDKICQTFQLDPANTIFIDDMAHNLKPAKDMGMTTVWLKTPHSSSLQKGSLTHVDVITEDLLSFLRTKVAITPTT